MTPTSGVAEGAGPVDEDVLAAVDFLFDCIADRRLEDTLAAFSPADDAAIYGSEVGEVAVGQTALWRFFETLYRMPDGFRFALSSRRISVRADVAWFTADAEVTVAGKVYAPYRITGILEKREGRWLWVLYSGSEPRPTRSAY